MPTQLVELTKQQIELLRYAANKANFFYIQRDGRDFNFERKMEAVEALLKELENE